MGKKHKKHHKKPSEAKAKHEEPPIKLVLKVGSTEKNTEHRAKEHNLPPDAHRLKDHSGRKKKKKRSGSKDRKKRKHTEAIDDHGESSSTVEIIHERPKKKQRVDEGKDSIHMEKPLIKKIHIKPIEPPKEHRRIKAPEPKYDEPTPVVLCLSELHQTLQRKDINGFFAYPVNDVIAPGYSAIITNPMDFSTMKYNIDRHIYTTLEEFRDDYNLMCNNAMIYNAADTIYFKAAKKLQQIGAKLMSVDKFRGLYRAMGLPHLEELAQKRHDEKEEFIDVDTVDGSAPRLLPPPKKKDSKPKKKPNMSQRIQSKAEEAARKAAQKLAKKCPNSNIGFLRKDADGNTTLAILNPRAVDTSQSIPVNLAGYVGKLSSGSLSTTLFQEDKKNKATPVSYLKYGPFSSFSPSYDSSNATITKEDSDLLYSTYGDSIGTYYAQSLQAFVKDNLLAKDFVDHLLDALTAGAHSKLMNRLNERLVEEEKEREEEEEKLKQAQKEAEEKKAEENRANKSTRNSKASSQEAIDFDALLSLEKEGIDMSFLKTKENTQNDEGREVQDKLDTTADLITKLDKAQSQRLSQTAADVTGATPRSALEPSETEQAIAEKVTQELANLTSKIQPKEVVDTESVRKAVGVGDISAATKKPLDQDEMEVQLSAEAIETVFNETTTMEDLDKVICEAAREVEDAMGLDVLDDLTASLDDVKRIDENM